MISKLKQFIMTDIWRIRAHTLPKSKSLLIQNLRIVLISLRGFAEDKCQLRASALTYYSLLSIVPVVAMAFGIAKGFGFEKMLQDQLMQMQGQEEVVSRIIEFSNKMLENTRGGLIAGIGVALLFWTVIKVLGNIELSFNDIWGIKTPRTLIRKFSDYLAIMLICPILLMVSSSMTVFITSQITLITEKIALLGPISPLIFFAVKILPYGMLWVLFSFIYIVMPNTKVNFSSGLFAGVVSGTIFQIVQWAYITFQLGASKFGAIYGSFAALPLFLVWLQMSWLVVLLGAEISFAHQNVSTYEFEPDCLNISNALKRLLTLRVCHLLVIRFNTGDEPLPAHAISQKLDIPIRLVNQIMYDLMKAGLVVEVKIADEREHAYHPALDTNQLTIQYVINALETSGSSTLPLEKASELDKLQASLQSFNQLIEKSSANVLLKSI